MTDGSEWLTVRRGEAPLVISLPHTGTLLPPRLAGGLLSTTLALKDTDWWVDRLYDFGAELDATVIHTAMSRTVIDVNRDPSGTSLYPGQTTTELCPTTTFDGEPLYRSGAKPSQSEVARRIRLYFGPYHRAISAELFRLRARHARVVLYDCHSIRSRVPRLFDGLLPVFNIGTKKGASCDPDLTAIVERHCDATAHPRVTNGRFTGGYISRHFGLPAAGVHAVQMELACRGYMTEEPGQPYRDRWPPPYDPVVAAPMRATLLALLREIRAWASL